MKSSAAAAPANAAPPSSLVSSGEGEKKSINPELWQACAGPLVNLPAAGTHVIYFPQGHSEQVAASMKKNVDAQIPNYSNLSSKLLCLLHNVTLHADLETDEVYAQMTLQPVPSFDKEALLRSDLSLKVNKPQTEFFCKTLTPSDTSTHGGFSVPRRAAEKIFPPLDFSMQPPAQELTARDLHDNLWTFRHIYRGQPKRHLLTSGWSLFVNGKRLFAGDSVLFIRDEKQNLLLGMRRANRQPPNLSSSVLSSDSMHIGILAAAAHAAANNSPFTVFYNPRASPSEFVIPLAKYYQAACGQQISLGMRFRMLFETEESGTRRYMGTITGISDLDPARWKNSQWRNLQVGWDESNAGERRTRVSAWEIEPVTAPFYICPPFFRPKHPREPGASDDPSDFGSLKRAMPWLGEDYMKEPQALNGLNMAQRMNMHQSQSLVNSMQANLLDSLPGFSMQGLAGADMSRQLEFSARNINQQNNMHSAVSRQTQQLDQLQRSNSAPQPQQQLPGISHATQNMIDQTATPGQVNTHVIQSPSVLQTQNTQFQRGFSQGISHQQPVFDETWRNNMIASQLPKQSHQPSQVTSNQLELMQKFQQQQQSLIPQHSSPQQLSQPTQPQDLQKSNASQRFCSSVAPGQVGEMTQMQAATQYQSQALAHQMSRNSDENSHVFLRAPELPKLQPQHPGAVSNAQVHGGISTNSVLHHASSIAGSSDFTRAVTDNVPSSSTFPSTNNIPNSAQTVPDASGSQRNNVSDRMARTSPPVNVNGLETMMLSGNTFKDFQQRSNIKPSPGDAAKPQSQELFGQQTHQNVPGSQLDYLDSSSATSASLPRSDARLPQNSSFSFNSQPMLLRDTSQVEELQTEPENQNMNSQMETTVASSLIKDFSNISSGALISGYDNCKDGQQELSSSMVTQSFGVPDLAFNSIDSAMNMNQGAWGPPPQYQRMRTYTKVYKRGAVGRSIDVTRYSDYEELKQDLARRFGIEGQLEDRGRVGWKLVYVDHENDVLLVGDDPWEEFIRCVRCIKILSPQEVQQMSLDGDYGNLSQPNQACSSSDGGNV